jgi:ParB-like nuclease domain
MIFSGRSFLDHLSAALDCRGRTPHLGATSTTVHEVRSMKVELWSISRVKPYEKNPRINDDAVDAVAASIREFGFRQPIVVDADGVIICGHTRYKAAHKLGLDKVPVHVAKDLTP